ncbi:MAG: hypothetical protein N2489_04635 [Clostridia bacterium]|nr:hypothetical protein [Clostridia bacterium]
MNGYGYLYELANGIYAAGRIGEVINSAGSKQTRAAGGADPVCVLGRILEILSQYAPERQRGVLGEAAKRSRVCNEIYRNLNQSLNTYRNGRLDRNNLVKTLAIMQPLLGKRERVIIDKLVKLNDIFS